MDVERSPLELGKVDGRGSAAGVEGGGEGVGRKYGFTRVRWFTRADGVGPRGRRCSDGGVTISAVALVMGGAGWTLKAVGNIMEGVGGGGGIVVGVVGRRGPGWRLGGVAWTGYATASTACASLGGFGVMLSFAMFINSRLVAR